MKVQISLTVEAGKRLIAKAILTLPAVRNALAEGQLLLKGGTTVSLISEAVCGVPLKICGRIDRRGAGSCAEDCSALTAFCCIGAFLRRWTPSFGPPEN